MDSIHHPIFLQEELDLYGIDRDGPTPLCREEPTVEVPRMACPISEEELAHLKHEIDPLSESLSFGADVYVNTCKYLGEPF